MQSLQQILQTLQRLRVGTERVRSWYGAGLTKKISVMRTVQDYIAIIRQNSSKITKDFGIKTLRIFGSVSRNEQTEQSDLDVCVETETPNPFLLADLKEFLEDLF